MRHEGPFRRFFDEVDASAALRAFVLAKLSAPSRHWHGLLHHALMLHAIHRAGHPPSERRRLILAVLFHDIVYDATRTDNEEASAAVARSWLAGTEADAVAALILATRTHDLAAADPVTRTLLESDLAVLWTPSASLYAFYAAGIRREYAHVPKAAYGAGRAAVLTRLEVQLHPALSTERAARLSANLSGERARLADSSA